MARHTRGANVKEAPAIRPIDPNNPDVRRLASIELAHRNGMPWTAIAKALGVPDKRAAKRLRRELHHRVRVSQQIPAPAITMPGVIIDEVSPERFEAAAEMGLLDTSEATPASPPPRKRKPAKRRR